jgi:hypothetical protein
MKRIENVQIGHRADGTGSTEISPHGRAGSKRRQEDSVNLHLSRDHKLSPEASKFLTDVLEFLVEDDGKTLYLVDRAKSDLCLLVAYNKAGYGTPFGPIACLHQLGIMSRPYTDRHGTAVIPTIQPIVEMDHDVFESFEENFGRNPTKEESQAIQDAIIDAAASTPTATIFRGARLDPPRPRQQRLSMTDHDLAGDFAACVMAPSGLGVGKGKHAVNDRSDPMLFHHSA